MRIFYFFELSPHVKLRPFEKIEMKFCKVLKIESYNLCQLKGDDERSIW